LANPDIMKELGLKLPCKVIVSKRNDVIPKIERVSSVPDNAKEIKIPIKCTTCGGPLINEGSKVYCPNELCERKAYYRIKKWVSRNDIQNLGDSTIRKLYDLGLVKRIKDLYKLQPSHISDIDGLGDKSAAKIIENISKTKELDLISFVAGFNIEGIGEGLLNKMSDAGYDTFDKLKKITVSQLTQIDGIGNIIAKKFYDGLHQLLSEMEITLKYVKIKSKEIKHGNLTGKTFQFTGRLDTMSRDEAKKKVEDNGGKVLSSVGKELNYLVTNDTESGSSKNEKAKKLGIKIISEKDFLRMI